MFSVAQSELRMVCRQASTLACSNLDRFALCEFCRPCRKLVKLSVVSVLHSDSDVPAASLPINWSAVQQLYAFGQIASAKSVAVLSIGMASTPPQPSNAADRSPSKT